MFRDHSKMILKWNVSLMFAETKIHKFFFKYFKTRCFENPENIQNIFRNEWERYKMLESFVLAGE